MLGGNLILKGMMTIRMWPGGALGQWLHQLVNCILEQAFQYTFSYKDNLLPPSLACNIRRKLCTKGKWDLGLNYIHVTGQKNLIVEPLLLKLRLWLVLRHWNFWALSARVLCFEQVPCFTWVHCVCLSHLDSWADGTMGPTLELHN